MVRRQPILACGAALMLASSPSWAVAAAPRELSSSFEDEIGSAKAAMMAQPEQAFAHAQHAAVVASHHRADKRALEIASANWLMAEAQTRLKHPASALPLLNAALEVVERSAPNTKLNGDVLKSRGRAQAALGRVQLALVDLQTALRIYQRANEARSEALALNEIGSIYLDARDYAHVLSYYGQAVKVFSQDDALDLAGHNNRGFALKELGRLPEAAAEFDRALSSAGQLKSGYLQALF